MLETRVPWTPIGRLLLERMIGQFPPLGIRTALTSAETLRPLRA